MCIVSIPLIVRQAVGKDWYPRAAFVIFLTPLSKNHWSAWDNGESVFRFQERKNVQNWDTFLAKKYAPATRQRKLAAIKSLFSFAHQHQLLPPNPGQSVKIPKTKDAIAERILTEDEWMKLLYAEPNRQHQLMLQLLYETRARVSEFCSLKWRDIREKADSAALVTLFGKGNKTRKVTIRPGLWQILKATKPAEAKGNDPLFLNYRHKAYSTVQVWRIVKAAGERVGIYPYSCS